MPNILNVELFHTIGIHQLMPYEKHWFVLCMLFYNFLNQKFEEFFVLVFPIYVFLLVVKNKTEL